MTTASDPASDARRRRAECVEHLHRIAADAQRLVIAGRDTDAHLYFVAAACDAAERAYFGWQRSRRLDGAVADLVGQVAAVAGNAPDATVRGCAREALAWIERASVLRVGRESVGV